MDSKLQTAATAYVAPKVMRGFKFRWLLYGAAAYYGLKYMNNRGIMPKQTGAALDLIDRGIGIAKQQFGFSNYGRSNSVSDTSLNSTLSH